VERISLLRISSAGCSYQRKKRGSYKQ